MYAKYKYKAGSTHANLVSDIVAILCGEISVANLSADADQTLTTIDASFKTAGWTLHDAAPGIASYDTQIIKAPHVDDPTQFKYAEIGSYSTRHERLYVGSMEHWDEVGKIATNRTHNNSGQYGHGIDLVDGGSFYIWATERALLVYAKTDTYSGTGPTLSYPSCLAHLEITRLDFGNDVGTCPSVVSGLLNAYGDGYMYTPRIDDMIVPSSSLFRSGTIGGFGNGDIYSDSARLKLLPNRNVGGETSYVFHPIMMSALWNQNESQRKLGGAVSELTELWMTQSTGSVGDQIVVNGTEVYVLFPVRGHNSTCICARIA